MLASLPEEIDEAEGRRRVARYLLRQQEGRAFEAAARRQEALELELARQMLQRERQEARDRERLANPERYRRRHRWNLRRAQSAVEVLSAEPARFEWLLGPPMKVMLLAELGQIRDREQLLELAAVLCRARPRSVDGERWVRDHRRAALARTLPPAPATTVILEDGSDGTLYRVEVVAKPGGVCLRDDRGEEVASGHDLTAALGRLERIGWRCYVPTRHTSTHAYR